MRVTIVDLDWYNKESFVPNVKCMKLSSYHIQRGDLVLLAQHELDLQYQFDVMYVVREHLGGKLPSALNLRDERVQLIGSAFRFFDRYAEGLTDVQAACRPDYNLYPISSKNKLAATDMAQFYNADTRLEVIQNFQGAKTTTRNTLIVDKGFWEKNIEDIRACVQKLRKSKNIVFQEPISLKNLIKRPDVVEIFYSMKFSRLHALPFVNDCDIEDNNAIIDFLGELHRRHPQMKRPNVAIEILTEYHGTDTQAAIRDFARALQWIERAKKQNVIIKIIGPLRSLSPFWIYFEELEAWMRYHPTMSLVEHLCVVAALWHKMDITNLLYNPSKWSSYQTEMLGDMIRLHPDILLRYGFLRSGDNYFHHPQLEETLRRNLYASVHRHGDNRIVIRK